jgi:putative SOS response-associated peptidase YedK
MSIISWEFSDLRIRFNLDKDLPEFKPSYNIAPGQQVPVIIGEDGRNKVKLMRWGLVPSWAPDPSIGNRMINARSGTLTEKPSFKQLLGTYRCLIPADGFYEWRREGKGKVPMRIVMKDRQLFIFAGLCDVWRGDPEGGDLYTFTIITTNANALLRPIHNRMPVIIDRLAATHWLDPAVSHPGILSILLQPLPSELMAAYEVSKLVNDPHNDSAACITPADWKAPGPLFETSS